MQNATRARVTLDRAVVIGALEVAIATFAAMASVAGTDAVTVLVLAFAIDTAWRRIAIEITIRASRARTAAVGAKSDTFRVRRATDVARRNSAGELAVAQRSTGTEPIATRTHAQSVVALAVYCTGWLVTRERALLGRTANADPGVTVRWITLTRCYGAQGHGENELRSKAIKDRESHAGIMPCDGLPAKA